MSKSTNKGEFKEFLVESGYIAIVWGIAQSLNYFFSIMLARGLPPQDFAIFSSLLSIVYILAISSDTIYNALTKQLAKVKGIQREGIKKDAVKKLVMYATALSLAVVLLAGPLATIINVPTQYIYLVIPVIWGILLYQFVRGTLMAKRLIKFAYLLFLLEAILKYLIGALGLNLENPSMWGVLAFGLPMILISLIGIPLLINGREYGNAKFDTKELSPILLNVLALNGLFILDILYLPLDVRAPYASTVILGKVVFYASTMLVPVMYAKIVGSKKIDEIKTHMGRAVAAGLSAGALITLAYYFLGGSLVELVYDGMYSEIVPTLPIYAGAITLYAIASALINFQISRGRLWMWKIGVILLLVQALVLSSLGGTLAGAIGGQAIIFALSAVVIIGAISRDLYRNGV